ncbi:hypothetical protein Isop_0789 [Isosphaera pallida ATCC 43644]|jgi:hypothetical protein|uniref:Uncharacterized protein n=1 Tax=Isosphaera pallida (strain ATCC 43644 / DSM 9630 / IS1B) TaxID=575540 RepID=E8R1V8_ISOPI|nr:hypothetical protein [Isosphaera pallida]ADV61380.1 hypothetical protein Isop_0789 [Isosphaera pallida ATCC 43644]
MAEERFDHDLDEPVGTDLTDQDLDKVAGADGTNNSGNGPDGDATPPPPPPPPNWRNEP